MTEQSFDDEVKELILATEKGFLTGNGIGNRCRTLLPLITSESQLEYLQQFVFRYSLFNTSELNLEILNHELATEEMLIRYWEKVKGKFEAYYASFEVKKEQPVLYRELLQQELSVIELLNAPDRLVARAKSEGLDENLPLDWLQELVSKRPELPLKQN